MYCIFIGSINALLLLLSINEIFKKIRIKIFSKFTPTFQL